MVHDLYTFIIIFIPEDEWLIMYIYNHINILLMENVGKYSSPVDPMGIFMPNINGYTPED